MPITAFAAPHHARWPTDGGNHLIVGPPQSGKTTAAINAFVDYVSRHGPHRAVFLTPTRQQAARLRSVITNKFGGTTGHMLVRTPASLAFGVLRDAAVQQGKPSPTLITGPEQDHILSELIAGHLQDGVGPQWPSDITPDVLSMRAFRDELRDLLMRAAEAGLDGEQLTRLGNQQNRPEWVAAGEILTEYTLVTLLGQATPDRGARYDAATIVDQAVAHLHAHPDAAAFDVVVHDDYQDATLATSRLLTVLGHQGAQVLLASNPDTGVQGFRGGLPALTRTATLPLGSQEGALGAQAHVLSTVWMGPGVWNRVEPLTSDLPPLVGTARRHVTTVQGPTRWVEPVETVMLGSPHSEAAFIAHRLRQLHLVEGWAWSDMAVIVRSHHHAIRLRRALVNAQVPIEMEGVDLPLRDQAVVRAMLTCVEAATQGDGPTPEQVTEVLMSRFGLIDAITLRRIRRALRHHDPSRSSAEMLVGAIKDPELRAVAGDHPGFDRVAAMFRQARQAVKSHLEIDMILWEIWQASDVSKTWQEQALGTGPAAAMADSDLDAAVALFAVVEQFVQRRAGAQPQAFITHLHSQDFPADSLAQRAQTAQAVALHTPASAAGQHWPIVVVAGVQEEAWPDLRVRDSLLGAAELADYATIRHLQSQAARNPRQGILEDEKRMFLSACTRAREHVIVTAVADAEHQPSVFFDTLTTRPQSVRQVPPPLDLRGLVGTLRAHFMQGEQHPKAAQAAASLLAKLTQHGVDEADPRQWHPSWTGVGGTVAPGNPVVLHPSTIEQVLTCPLQWFLTRHGGRPADSPAQSLGSLIHEIAAEHPHGDYQTLVDALEQRWDNLLLPDNHLGRRQWQRAVEMLRRLAQYYASHPAEAEVEVAFEVDVGPAILKGSVDRIEHRDAGTHVVDFKTGTTRVTAKEVAHHPQLGAYQLAVAHGGFGQAADVEPGNSGGASLVFLGLSNKNVTVHQQEPLQQQDSQWALDMVEEAAKIVTADHFPARPSAACRTCAVRSSCPAVSDGEQLGD